jgi:hypothetical protein
VPGGQVDLILGAVQPEADRALGLAAVEVVDDQGLDLLGHRRFLSSLASSSVRPVNAHERNDAGVL